MPPLGKHESRKKKTFFQSKSSELHKHNKLVYGKGGEFRVLFKSKDKEGTGYQRTNVVKLHIFSVKSTLPAVLRPFQTSDRIRNMFKFHHSLNQYRCNMLTLQALVHTEDPKYELAGPFETMPQEPWHPNRARHNAKPVLCSSSHTGKCASMQAEKQSE